LPQLPQLTGSVEKSAQPPLQACAGAVQLAPPVVLVLAPAVLLVTPLLVAPLLVTPLAVAALLDAAAVEPSSPPEHEAICSSPPKTQP
jgi:hypothetical protein